MNSRPSGLRTAVLICTAALTAATLAGCNSSKSSSGSSGTILIGGVAGETGAYGETGVTMHRGAQIAIDELNKNGGILGKQVKLTFYNDNASATLAGQQFQKLVSAGAIAITGSSDAGPATAAAAERYKVPDLGIVDDGGPTIYPNGIGTAPNPWAYEFSPDNYAIGAKFAEYTLANCSGGLALLHDSTTYGEGVSQSLEAAYKQAGKSLAVNDTISEDWGTGATVGLTTEINKIKSSGADCVDVWLTPQDQASFVKTSATSGAHFTVLGNDESFATTTFTKLAGQQADGMLSAEISTSLQPNDQAKKFNALYKAKYGDDANIYAEGTYDAIMMVAQAAEQAKSTTNTDLQAQLDKMTNFDGTLGKLSFTEQNHQIMRPDLLTMVKYDATSKKWVPLS